MVVSGLFSEDEVDIDKICLCKIGCFLKPFPGAALKRFDFFRIIQTGKLNNVSRLPPAAVKFQGQVGFVLAVWDPVFVQERLKSPPGAVLHGVPDFPQNQESMIPLVFASEPQFTGAEF